MLHLSRCCNELKQQLYEGIESKTLMHHNIAMYHQQLAKYSPSIDQQDIIQDQFHVKSEFDSVFALGSELSRNIEYDDLERYDHQVVN